jgi:hypothetical protein
MFVTFNSVLLIFIIKKIPIHLTHSINNLYPSVIQYCFIIRSHLHKDYINVHRLIKYIFLQNLFYRTYICHYQRGTDLCTCTGSCECNAGYSYEVFEADI